MAVLAAALKVERLLVLAVPVVTVQVLAVKTLVVVQVRNLRCQ